MRETHRARDKRKVGGALLKLGLIATTTVAALAFASAARAEDQPAPPPLSLEKSALVAPEEEGTEVGDAASVPIDAVAPTEEEVDVVEPLEPKKPAKRPYERHARPVRARVVTAREPRRQVISGSRAVGRAEPKREAAKPVAHKALNAGGGWYHVVPSQYRPLEHEVRPTLPTHLRHAEERAVVRGVTPGRSEPHTAPIICTSQAEKCLELCASDASYNGSWNAPPISRCISSAKLRVALEKIHEIIAEGLHEASASARANAVKPRYQCGGAQYHDGVCADGAHVAVHERDAAAGWQLAGFVADDKPARTQAVTANDRPKRLGSVLGTAARRTLAQPAVKARAPSAMPTSSHTRPRAVARPLPAATTDTPSDDWFLRSLLALMGIAAVGVLLAIVFELNGAGEAVTALRSRIGSRGLSATRIALGARARPPDDIHYRK